MLAHLEAEIGGHHSGGVVVERLIDGGDGAVGEQGLDHLRHGHAEQRGQVSHADDRRQLDRPCRRGAGGGSSCGLGGASLEGLELAAPSAARLTGAVGGA